MPLIAVFKISRFENRAISIPPIVSVDSAVCDRHLAGDRWNKGGSDEINSANEISTLVTVNFDRDRIHSLLIFIVFH